MTNHRSMLWLGLVVAASLLCGCATAPRPMNKEDHWQGFNRGVYKFNDTLDRAALKPVAKGYKKVLPNWVRTGIGNFFDNLDTPTTIVNQLLQGKAKLAAKDTGRFLMNTIVGLGGFIDVATKAGLDRHDEDFGQTLAVWGVPSGPFLELPLLGPSDLRDAPSRLVDYFTHPLYYADMKWQEQTAIKAVEVVQQRSELLSLDATLQNAFDPYDFMRNAWVQRREYLIFDGDPPQEALIDESGGDDNDTTSVNPSGTPSPESAAPK